MDDVVPQRPEDVRFLVPVFHTSQACPGAVAAYMIRRIAYRAGAYAPGIQEAMFHELNTVGSGSTLDKVQRWHASRSGMLQHLGYRVQARRSAISTPHLLEWIAAGKGHRGALLSTSFKRLHPEPGMAGEDAPMDVPSHAVGVTVDRLDEKSEEGLVMVDPWPGVIGAPPDRTKVPEERLETAHRDRYFHAIAFYWVGWA